MQHIVGGGADTREPPSEPRTGTTAAQAVPTKVHIDTPPQSPPTLDRSPEQSTSARRNAKGGPAFSV